MMKDFSTLHDGAMVRVQLTEYLKTELHFSPKIFGISIHQYVAFTIQEIF